MKISANLIVSCPSCESVMIIKNPLRQTTLSNDHKIEQKCNGCEKIIVMWIKMSVEMWEVKNDLSK